jgi:phospholipid/cholesterol/gamma-HCH transport system substrate-binding protein
MDERIMQFRLGVLIIGSILIAAIILTLVINSPSGATLYFFGGKYFVFVHFNNAPNVKVNTPVRKSGVLIGRVSEVKLLDEGGVVVSVKIEDKYHIRNDEIFEITNELLGDAVIDVVPNGNQPAPSNGDRVRPASFQTAAAKEPAAFVEPGSTIEGRVILPPSRVVQDLYKQLDSVGKEVNNASVALAGAGNSIKITAERLNNVLDEETQQNMRSAAKEASESLASIRTILGDKETQQNLQMALKDLPLTIEALKGTLNQANSSMRKFSTPIGPGQKTPIDQMIDTIGMVERTLRDFTTAERPGQTPPVDRLKSAMQELDVVAGNLANFTNQLNRQDTTLGRFLNDQEIYQHLNRAATNIDTLTRQLRPVLDDARVISDKMARHPGAILRDAVQPGPGIK